MRKTVLLRKIIKNFSTPSELRQYDILVEDNKGSATHYALRLLDNYFTKRCEKSIEVRENSFKTKQPFKINHNGQSWLSE